MPLTFSNNAITGNLAGKPIHCAVRMSQGTGSPARGEYVIPPPASDAIYGKTALLFPLTQGSTGLPAGWAQAGLNFGYAPTNIKIGYAPTNIKISSVAASAGAERQALAKEVLVLSDKPIAGRNCLVVSLGFADLMLGLEASGGATLTVR